VAEKPELLTMEYKPGFSMLAACLGRIAAAEGVLWTLIALFAGQETASLLQPGAVLAAGAAGFLVNHLLLQSARPLLLLLGVNTILTAIGGWLTAESVLAVGICAGIGLALGLFSQLYWEIRQFRDETLMVQLQVLLLTGVWQLWFSGQLGLNSDWIPVTFLAAGIQLMGITMSKISGLSSAGSGGRLSAGAKAGLVAAVIGAGALICGGAAVLAEPVGMAVRSGYEAVDGVLETVLTVFAAVIAFLFRGKKIRLDGSGAAAGGMEEETGMAESSGGGDFDFFLILFYAAAGAILLMLLVTLLRALLQITVGAVHRTARSRRKWEAADGTLLERFRYFFREIRQQIRARRLLRQNPDSVAALLVFLEAKCARSRQLRRQPGETAREFLVRLADCAEGQQPGMGEILLRMADAADRACYSREGDLLLPCEESKAIRSFFRENP